MSDEDDGSDQDIGVDRLAGDTTSDEEWDPAQEQARVQYARNAEARAVAWAKKLDGGGRARDRSVKGFASRVGVLTQLERAGLPLARVRWLQMVGGDPGRSAVLSAAPGEHVATADLPARPAVDAMRAAWSRHMGLDALNRAAVALLRGAGVQDGVTAAATMPEGHPPRGSRKRAAAGAPAAGAGRGRGRYKRHARRSSREGSDDDAAAVAPAAAGAMTPPEAKTYQTASPGGGHGRVRRGPQASIRRARRTQLATAVRRVLRRTRLSRWTVPRHEAEKVARWLVDSTAAAGNSASSTTPNAPLQDQVDALPRRKVCRRLAPVSGLRYSLSAAHFREASGGNFLACAWKQWRARSGTEAGPVAAPVAGLVAAAGDEGGVAGHLPPVDLAAALGTMRTSDGRKHLQATLEWAARRDTASYVQRFGAQATRHLRATRVRKAIQRGRFAASVARDLTGGLLRQVRGGGAVVVAMGTARVRGGDAGLRRHFRRLCWFVDQDEFNTSQACSECHDKMVLIYSTGNSLPKVPGELDGPPPGPLPSTRRVRMAAGMRRGRPKRPLPTATHVTRRGPDPDAYRAAVRATARAAAVARRAAALAACAVEDRAIYADPKPLSE
ncbi:hypothetical protein I4F81_004571 [Pyropia yezoensis]|uniref:Uncharacterized protein n=1 Tax=Pyropia yezoensis TaxID=2788 RepID=A0ACC3BW67_PYRYE|nr:hypothetical protein I4F81_004571 [Neopyropia yezoensis]